MAKEIEDRAADIQRRHNIRSLHIFAQGQDWRAVAQFVQSNWPNPLLQAGNNKGMNMGRHEYKFDAQDEDVAETCVVWWPGDPELFIKQTERGGKHVQTLLINRRAIPDLIKLLQAAVVHDSGCATHNEPAMPNGPCDCSFAPRQQQGK